MHHALAAIATGLVSLGWQGEHRCLLVEPAPLGGHQLAHPAAGEQQQSDQLREPLAHAGRGERVQCSQQLLELIAG